MNDKCNYKDKELFKILLEKDYGLSWTTQIFLKKCPKKEYLERCHMKVLTCGNNHYSQLGIGHDKGVASSIEIENFTGVKQIACGVRHTMFLNDKREVFACGDNEFGQLGLGDKKNRNIPTKITTLQNENIIQIICGYRSTVFLNDKGEVFACGENYFGQFGLGDSKCRIIPTKIEALQNINIKEVACGNFYTIFLNDRGEVFGCGNNEYGQLGFGIEVLEEVIPTKIESFPMGKIVQIACGDSHTIFLNDKGEVFGCGDNQFGQLSIGVKFKKIYAPTKIESLEAKYIKQIACGENYTIFLNDRGEVFASGSNEFGQLGLASEDPYNNPKVFTPTKLSFIFMETADEYAKDQCAYILRPKYSPISAMGDIQYIRCGGDYTIFLNSEEEYLYVEE